MSATNAIHGIVLLGGLLLIGAGRRRASTSFILRDRDRVRHDQRGRRLPGHRPDARDVQEAARRRRRGRGASDDPRAFSSRTTDFIRVCSTSSRSRCSSSGCSCLTSPRTARRGNLVGGGRAWRSRWSPRCSTTAIGELRADRRSALAIGTAVGVPAARSVKMTAMPQMVALFNGVGGGAVALIAWAEFRDVAAATIRARRADPDRCSRRSSARSRSGARTSRSASSRRSFPAARSRCPGAAVHQRRAAADRAWAARCDRRRHRLGGRCSSCILVAAAVLGNTFVLPIGGADMPVVISLLNAFTGLSAAAAGIALDNIALIVAGMLVGASGSILTKLMAEAMNRSIPAIMRRRLRRRRRGHRGGRGRRGAHRALDRAPPTWRSSSPTPSRVVIVPGYGMAVAQAQHAVRELARAAREARRRRQVRDPPGGRPHARPHERAARRGRRALRPAQRDGRDQPASSRRPTWRS